MMCAREDAHFGSFFNADSDVSWSVREDTVGMNFFLVDGAIGPRSKFGQWSLREAHLSKENSKVGL